jgi:hypothetical protein
MTEGPTAFMNFQNAMAKIVSVPKAEFLRREAEHKKASDANPNKREPKKKKPKSV